LSSIIKESLKTSGINYVGILLGAFFTLYLTPKYFPTEYNGLLRLLLEYSAIAAIYFHFGLPTLINKYYHRVHGELAIVKGFDFLVFICPLIVLTVFSVILSLYKAEVAQLISSKKNLDIIIKYLLFLIPLVVCNAYFFVFEAYSAMLGNITFINFFKNIILKLFNIFSVLLFVYTRRFELVLIVVSIGYVLSTVIVFFYILKLKNFKIDVTPSLDFLRKNNLLKDFVKFFLFLCLSNLTFFLLSKIDIFFVGKFTDLSNLAYYSTATYFVTLLLVPYSAVLNISFPRIAKSYAVGDINTLKELIVTNSIFGFVLALYVFIVIWTNLDIVYNYIPNGELYKSGKYIFLILSVGRLIDISIGSIGQLITISKWYFYTLFGSIIISVVSIVAGYLLTKNYGIIGAASSITVCVIISVLFQLGVAKVKIGITPYTSKILIVMVIMPVIVIICYMIDSVLGLSPVMFLAKIFLTTILYFYVVYRFKVSSEIVLIIDRMKSIILK